MTIPIMPTPGYGLAQGIGQALKMYLEQKMLHEDRQRQQAQQGLALFSQILPSLAKYQPAQTSASFAPNLMEGGQGIQTQTTPEQFNVPAPPPMIQSYLKSLTGQGSLGLSSEQMDSLRKNYFAGQTAPAEAQLPGAKLAEARANTRTAEARIPQIASEVKGQDLLNKKNEYGLSMEPHKDALAFTDKYAPGAVLEAAATLKIPINKQNANAIAQKAWITFKSSQASNPVTQYVTPAEFTGAVMDQINLAEKLGIEKLHALAAMKSAQNATDPKRYWQEGVDNEQNAINSLQTEQSRLQATFKDPTMMMYAMSGNVDLNAPGVNLTPEEKNTIMRLRAIPGEIQLHANRRDKGQDQLNSATGLNVPGMGTKPPPTQGSTGETVPAYKTKQEVGATLNTSTNRAIQKAAFLTMIRNHLVNPAEIDTIVREIGIIGLSKDEINAALAGGRP